MIATLSRLLRMRLALMNGVAAVGGSLLFPGSAEPGELCALGGGVALLAGAGSALNQLLERDLDALMQRTRLRPLPTGELTPLLVLLTGLWCLLAGSLLLFAAGGMFPVLLGWGTLAWYLAVYTPLKRRTPFALLLGALCGAVTPVIGWSAAGGSLSDFRIILLAGVLYLWQIPHFWLLQRRHADDYRRAGFPLFAPPAKESGAAPFFQLWVVAMIASALMLPAFGVISRSAAPWCLAFCVPLLLAGVRKLEPMLFASLNLFPLLVTAALYAGR